MATKQDHIKQRLGRLHQGRHRAADVEPDEQLAAAASPSPTSAPPLSNPFESLPGSSLLWEERGAVLACLEQRYPPTARHGEVSISQAVDIAVESLGLAHPKRQDQLLFLDIETEGLERVTTIFCIGLGRLEPDGSFHVKQLVINQPHAQEALFKVFKQELEALGPATCLFSFNGKSFDVPRLVAGALAHGVELELAGLEHVDLLQVMRGLSRQKRGQRKRLSLSAVEASELGVVRRNDVPGSAAPGRWRRFVQTQDLGYIHGLLKHNVLDVLSLVTLASVLSQAAAPRTTPPVPPRPSSADPYAPAPARAASMVPAAVSATRADAASQVAKHLGQQLGEKLTRSYELRGRSSAGKGGHKVSAPVGTAYTPPAGAPQADVAQPPKPHARAGANVDGVRARLEVLQARLDAMLEHGASDAECFPLLVEIVALEPAHTASLERLVKAYQALRLEEVAAALRLRLSKISPY